MGSAPGPLLLHASTVALFGRGCLISGPSGSGKSTLALSLMALGAALVADDRTELWREGDAVMAGCPKTLKGLIEARGLGLLNAEATGPVPLSLVVDLAEVEVERLPPRRSREILGQSVTLVHKLDSPGFPAALLQYMKGGRQA